jgi:excinuclease ABC subunit B
MKALIETTEARRAKQNAYNAEHGIVPHTIIKPPRETIAEIIGAARPESAAPAVPSAGRAYTFHEPGAPYNTGLKTRPARAKKGRGMKGQAIPLSETEEILKQTGAASIDELVLELESQMLEAAEALEFERAAQLRDQIRSLSKDLDAPPF